jgi:hypothetical protein
MRRLILMVAAVATVAVPTGIAVVTMAPAAGAASGTTCSKMTGNISTNVVFKKCLFTSGKDKTNKTLSGKTSALATGGTLTWAPSGQTTIVGSPTFTSPGQGACKPKNTEYVAHATVTGGTSTHTKVGDTFASTVCLKASKLSLLKGTVAHL